MANAKVSSAKIKGAEDSIRDLINWVTVWNKQVLRDGGKKISDKSAEAIKKKLRAIAKKVGDLK